MKISLKKKKLKTGKYSLFIEYYKGTIIDKNGKTKHDREFEYLKEYLVIEPKTKAEKQKNKETLKLAEKILSIRQAEYYQGKYKIQHSSKEKTNFLEYYNQKKEERYQSETNYDNWEAAQKHIEAFCPSSTTFNDIDIDFIKNFQKYLHTEAKTKAGQPLAQNTKHTYYNKFKACLRCAFDEGFLKENYVEKVRAIPMGETHREYLTIDEVQALSKTTIKQLILKKAFLFSCLTGIRWSDINKMKWNEVRDEGIDDDGNPIHRVVFSQKKTKGVEYLYISPQAREFLGDRKRPEDRVFVNLHYSAQMNINLIKWCMSAGITKHITFHSARHTNAVLLLENGADIYTVSKRLGHKEIRTTEIYAKIIDKKMKEAANLIPLLKIDL
ncbi:tyrosine-type recombinase/integrase [Tenacibaculum aiptasiae]|uniref:tyrosine-type recombinase/integrase n=1 Tax=Tenacibaculum aiptasiae TaxID=426481 RepID=UPI00232CEADB|nr:site-specific integrase [Tenacibaculum aiptasiae]